MLEFIGEKKNCVGCSACFSVCPMKCIELKMDEEGFLYPEVSGDCIKCGKCEKVCPISNPVMPKTEFKQLAYAGVTKDVSIWRRSASGGAFSEICKSWDDGNTLYVGAAWNGLKVHHICIKGKDNILNLCKSKYVSSNLENVFKEVKKHLDGGNRALFSGTPCQVAGLRKYLGKDYQNLLLVDLICHGVGSPKVFQECMYVIEKQLGQSLKSYEFRAKKHVFEFDHIQKIKTEDGREIYLDNDPYIQLFLAQNCLRPSCGKNCIYRNEMRQGDITIADFKGLEKVFPDLIGTKRNYSSIIINNEKGNSVMPILSETMILRKCSLEDIKKYNPLFYRQTWFSEKRDSFFEEFKSSPQNTIEKWTMPTNIHRRSLKGKIWCMLPAIIRKRVKTKILG